jgi:hypothetical protein
LIQKSTIQFLDHQQTEERNVKRCITKGVYWGGEKFWGYVNSTQNPKPSSLQHPQPHQDQMPGSNAGITNPKHCQGSPWSVPAEHSSLGGEEELFCICLAIVALHLHCYSSVFFCSNKNR